MVGQRTLNPPILVRIQAREPASTPTEICNTEQRHSGDRNADPTPVLDKAMLPNPALAKTGGKLRFIVLTPKQPASTLNTVLTRSKSIRYESGTILRNLTLRGEFWTYTVRNFPLNPHKSFAVSLLYPHLGSQIFIASDFFSHMIKVSSVLSQSIR